jgi:DNA-binding MarR family transcriptional regulator
MANSTPTGTNSPTEADFAVLVVGAARSVTDRLNAAVAEAGIEDMSSRYGFVIRALSAGGRTLTELAEMLAVSKQAAIKVVDEMERRGFLTRVPDPRDRRAKRLELTERGRRVRAAALAASHELERELRAELGDGDVEAMRRALLRFLERHDGLEVAQEGRARALW